MPELARLNKGLNKSKCKTKARHLVCLSLSLSLNKGFRLYVS